MKNSRACRPRACLVGLDGSLEIELARALRAAAVDLTDDPAEANIVFCDWNCADCRQAAACSRVPYVVVSRLPEVQGWLDALEAGAADYCAAPFEEIQIRWLIETHLPPRPVRGRSRHAAA